MVECVGGGGGISAAPIPGTQVGRVWGRRCRASCLLWLSEYSSDSQKMQYQIVVSF